MALIQTDDARVVRDTDNRALLSTNMEQLQRHRKSRAAMNRITQQARSVDDRFELLTGRLDRCEALLSELVQHISALVSKSSTSFPERD